MRDKTLLYGVWVAVRVHLSREGHHRKNERRVSRGQMLSSEVAGDMGVRQLRP